jgi:hypothetical protein
MLIINTSTIAVPVQKNRFLGKVLVVIVLLTEFGGLMLGLDAGIRHAPSKVFKTSLSIEFFEPKHWAFQVPKGSLPDNS